MRANLYYIITHRFSSSPPLKTKCFDGSHIVGVRKECTSQGPACEKKEANHPLSEKVIFVVRRRVLYSGRSSLGVFPFWIPAGHFHYPQLEEEKHNISHGTPMKVTTALYMNRSK